MRKCQRAFCGGSILLGTDNRRVCLLCGLCVQEDESTVLENLLSNMTPEADSIPHGRGRRANVDVAAITERVMARIRIEAGR